MIADMTPHHLQRKQTYHLGVRAHRFGCLIVVSLAAWMLLLTLFPEALIMSLRKDFQEVRSEIYEMGKTYSSDLMSALHGQNDNQMFTGKKSLQTLSENDGTERCKHRLPKVLVVGFPKSGTGTFMEFISIHPDVAVTRPWELHFFDSNYEKGIEWYRERMPCTLSNQITIEKTPKYSWYTPVVKRVHDMDKNMRLIFVVRDPVQRIISQYARDYDPSSSPPIEKYVLFKDGSINSTNGWIKESRYHVHLKRWLRFFPFNQIDIVDGEDFATNPSYELQKAENFLNLQPYIKPEHFTFNATKGFYCVNKKHMTKCMDDEKGRKHPTISKELFEKLYDYYDIQNESFYEVVKQKFSWTRHNATKHQQIV